jgi:hypothetical protein
VIVDHIAFQQINANNGFIPTIDRILSEDQLTEDQLLTLPSMVYGFSLGVKEWGMAI